MASRSLSTEVLTLRLSVSNSPESGCTLGRRNHAGEPPVSQSLLVSAVGLRGPGVLCAPVAGLSRRHGGTPAVRWVSPRAAMGLAIGFSVVLMLRIARPLDGGYR